MGARQQAGRGQGDTREEIETYIKHLAEQSYDAARVETFLDAVPEAIEFFENDAGLDVRLRAKSPDYQMDAPGAQTVRPGHPCRKTSTRGSSGRTGCGCSPT